MLKMAIFHQIKGNNSEGIILKGEWNPKFTTIHADKYFCEDFIILGQILYELHAKQVKNGYFSQIQGQ